jgi:GT2 family glycosyltransferase
MMPRFSVIIPAYNSEATLARAIDSVLAQNYPAHEIIVVDDGSTDGTPDVVSRYDKKLRYLHQNNTGVSSARNLGAQVASGDWLAFLDADDWYYPDRLRLHAEWILEDATLDFLTGDYDYRRPDGSFISCSMDQHESGRSLLARANGAQRILMTADDLEAFVADHFGDTHTLSVSRRKFLELGGYPTGFKVCEDVFFLITLCAVSNRIGVVCSPLAAYVIHAHGATRKDPLSAQVENVRTLTALKTTSSHFPVAIQRGIRERLRLGRLNLGYALVRTGQRAAALRSVAPSILENGMAGFRDILSVLV